MSTPVFYTPLDGALTTLSTNHTAGGNTLTVADSSVFGSPSSSAPLRITVTRQSDQARCHYKITSISGNVLTINSVIDGYTDINFVTGDSVSVNVSSGTVNDIHDSILNMNKSTSTKTYYAGSINGAVLDCNLITHLNASNAAPTDNASFINSTLSTSSAINPVTLVVDGGAAVNSPVLIPNSGHAIIIGNGWDTGFYSLPGTNDCTIRKADSPLNPFDPGGTPPSQGGSVILSRLKVDGGRGTYPSGNVSTTGSGWDARGQLGAGTDGPIYPAVDLFNLTGIIMDQVWVYDACVFAARFGNTSNIFSTNCRLESPGRQSNTDGLHFSGYCTDIHIANLHGETGDDLIALNADEGQVGPITRACITNVTLDNCWTAMRVYGFDTSVSKVVASNMVGSVTRFAVIYGVTTGTSPVGNNESLRLANCDISIETGSGPNAYIGVYGSGNSIELDGVVWTHPLDAFSWFYWGMPVTVDNISIRAKLIRNEIGNAAASMFDMSQGSCGLLRIEDYAVVDQAGSSYAAIPYLLNLSGSASISRIWIGSLDAKHHTAFTNDFTKIGSIGGPGVATCGFSFPDAVIANGTIYNSSTQGGLAWKDLAGTVHTFAFGVATGYTLTGPSSGVVNVASSNFTISPSGTYNGTITITPSGGGLSTPIVKTFSNSSTPQTFTITPTSSGTVTLTPTNSGSLTDPSALTYSASSTVMSDTFAGTTGNSLTGTAPSVPFGSIVWDDLFALDGVNPLVFKAGGGIVAPAGAKFSRYDLSDAPANMTCNLTFRTTDATGALIVDFRRTETPSENEIGIVFVFDGGGSVAFLKKVSGTSTTDQQPAFTFAANTDYAAVINLATSGGSTTITLTLNGTTVGTPYVVSDSILQTSAYFLIASTDANTTMTANSLSISSLSINTP